MMKNFAEFLHIGGNGPASPTRSAQSHGSTTVTESAGSSPTDRCFTSTSDDDMPEDPTPGWPQLAKLISEIPDFEAFPAFTDLNLKSLLYYQAELTMLRKKLHAAEYADARTPRHDEDDADEDIEPSDYAKRLDHLFLSRSDKESKSQKQWLLIKQIREVLKDYNDALLQYSRISSLPKADDYNVETLRVWLRSRDFGNYPIQGPGAETWGDLTANPQPPQTSLKQLTKQFLLLLAGLIWSPKPKKEMVKLDLVVPRPGHRVDGLTLWVANEFVPFWQNLTDAIYTLMRKRSETSLPFPNSGAQEKTAKKEKRPPLNTYSEDRMLRFTSSVATVIACLLPTLAIAILAKLHSTSVLIGVIASFTAVFAIGLMFLTDAATSRVQIFTATAAFSAVMVVFVQNQNQN